MRVPLCEPVAENLEQRQAIRTAVHRVLRSGVYILGEEVAAFERELARRLGANYAVGVSSGTDALLATLLALGVGPGDEVLTTPFSFFATAGAIVRTGAKPAFCDVDPDTLCIDEEKAACWAAGKKALVAVHLFGRPCSERLYGIGLPVVEDAAQATGAEPHRGVAACHSFFPTKNLACLGDGGAVVTDDAGLYDQLRLLRQHGARPKHHHHVVGGNFRLDALQAAILRVKLPELGRRIEQRQDVAAAYREAFKEAALYPGVRLPAHSPHSPKHSYNQFVIRAVRRNELRAYLKAAGIGTAVYYPVPLHRQPALLELGYDPGSMPVAEAAAESVLALPMGPHVTNEQVAYVVDTIAKFYKVVTNPKKVTTGV